MVQKPVCDARLFGDVPDAARVVALAGEDANGRVENEPTLVLLSYGVIAREEGYMAQKFGEEYLRYRASARRWI